MSLNLKPVLNTQTDNEKLDVVNYNFDQIVNNGGGPKGYQGATGSQGLTGLTGAQGSQGNSGPTGVQGLQGSAAAELWKTNTGPSNNTLVPKHGTPTNPPSVMYGVDKLDPLYNSVFDEAAVLLNRKSGAYTYNLELTDDGVTASDGNKIIYSLTNISGVSNFQMGFYNTDITTGNLTNWKLYSDDFEFSDGTNNFLTLGSTGFNVFVPADFKNAATFNNTVRINSGNPGAGKVLTSTDTLGTVAWKAVSEIGGVVPVGTIVPILTSIFDDNTLFYKDAISSTLTAGEKLRIRHGAGYGAYSGWYLCNGQTWLSGTGNSKTVPNLCSFDYEIDDNTADTAAGGQFGAQGITANLAIVGGSNVLMTADYATGTSSYLIEDVITSSNVTIHTNASGTPVYDLTKLVYIIYIGEGGWYWQDGGTAGGTTIRHSYRLYKYFNSSTTAGGQSSLKYTTSPSDTYTTTDTTGTTVSISITFTPSSGYAFTSGSDISLYTTGSIHGSPSPDASVTQVSSTLNANGTITLVLSDSSFPAINNGASDLVILGHATAASSPTGLTVKRSTVGFAGTSSGSWSNQTVYINGSGDLSTTSQIFPDSAMNSSAVPGWYAQSLSGGWCYRYWTGSAFGTMNMTGVSNSPGSWYSGTGDSLFLYGGVGGYPRSVVQAQTGYSACDFYKYVINGSYGTARNVWTSQQYPSNMSVYAECFVVADNYHSGNTNYVSIDWTNNGYESGYASLDPCYGLFQYSHSAGTLTRLATACTDVNSTLYDNGSGTGNCSNSGGSSF